MTNVKLDDQFDDPYGPIDMIAQRASCYVKKPANIAWSIAVVGTVGFVFSNALFFQTGAHPAAFFETRSNAKPNNLQADEMNLPVSGLPAAGSLNANQKQVTRIVFDPNANTAPKPTVRPTSLPKTITAVQKIEKQIQSQQVSNNASSLEELQMLLAELGFYEGKLDGISGPQTQRAIDAYKANVGLRGIELTNAELITSAKNNLIVTAAIPKARPQAMPKPIASTQTKPSVEPREVKTVSYTPPKPKAIAPSNTIAKVQAGLRAFGNNNISVDGVSGAQTALAIQEFQTLFKLPATGKIDKKLIEKMTDVGLID